MHKKDIFCSFENATKGCKTKKSYSKGYHSFKLLAEIDPEKVICGSRWAKRFIDILRLKMGGVKEFIEKQ